MIVLSLWFHSPPSFLYSRDLFSLVHSLTLSNHFSLNICVDSSLLQIETCTPQVTEAEITKEMKSWVNAVHKEYAGLHIFSLDVLHTKDGKVIVKLQTASTMYLQTRPVMGN